MSFGFCRAPLHVKDGLKKYITDALRKSEQKLQVGTATLFKDDWEQLRNPMFGCCGKGWKTHSPELPKTSKDKAPPRFHLVVESFTARQLGSTGTIDDLTGLDRSTSGFGTGDGRAGGCCEGRFHPWVDREARQQDCGSLYPTPLLDSVRANQHVDVMACALFRNFLPKSFVVFFQAFEAPFSYMFTILSLFLSSLLGQSPKSGRV